MKRAIIPVFGRIEVPPLVSELAMLPEVQRLRHISLSNIDSCSLTAIGGVSRYEHSLGTALLAWHLADRLRLDDTFRSELVTAAALHDVAAPGLGHLFEEGCALAGVTFDHETRVRELFLQEGQTYYQVYLNKELGFRRLLDRNRILPQTVFDAIMGTGRCGEAINGSIDLDNIDNVARMLSRLAVPVDGDTLRGFTRIFRIQSGRIVVDKGQQVLFGQWLTLRRKLYNILMLERPDFAAKSMTKRAVALGLQSTGLTRDDWHLTDYQLLLKLREHADTARLVERLWLGDYYSVIGLYWVEGPEVCAFLQQGQHRKELEMELTSALGLTAIVDYIMDKRERTLNGDVPPGRALLGVMSDTEPARIRHRPLCLQVIRGHFGMVSDVSEDVGAAQSGSLLPFANT